MIKLLRIGSWWNTIVPQVLGWIYFSLLFKAVTENAYSLDFITDMNSKNYGWCVVLFFLALISIASFGYLFNDFCDVESDAKTGKRNQLSGLVPWQRVLCIITPLIIGIVAWVKLNQYILFYSLISNILFAAQIIALILYSMKPFRFKDRALLGAVTDAFYGHLNPALITVFVLGFGFMNSNWGLTVLILLGALCFVKGVRNILLHQIEDRKHDSNAHINTAVTKYGPWRVINFINHYLFPAEVFLLVCFTIVVCLRIPPYFIPLICFAVVSYLKFSGWKLGYADRRLVEFKFSYFMNDYYEGWLPVFTLIMLSVYQHKFVFLLILHVIIFPQFIIRLGKNFKAIKENFKTEEDY